MSITQVILLLFLASGTIIAINIEYRAIFIAPRKVSGNRFDTVEPIKVPSDHPIKGSVVKPKT